MDTQSKSQGSVLLDIEQELQGLLLEETFEIFKHKYTLRLLSEEETIWTYGFLNPKSTISIAVASRLATLAIGLRAVDGSPIPDVFQDKYNVLPQEKKDDLHAEHKEPQFIYAAVVMEWLRKQPDVFINQMHDAWQKLELRRTKGQNELKNSSGESLEKEESESLTELSQLGEQLATGSK